MVRRTVGHAEDHRPAGSWPSRWRRSPCAPRAHRGRHHTPLCASARQRPGTRLVSDGVSPEGVAGSVGTRSPRAEARARGPAPWPAPWPSRCRAAGHCAPKPPAQATIACSRAHSPRATLAVGSWLLSREGRRPRRHAAPRNGAGTRERSCRCCSLPVIRRIGRIVRAVVVAPGSAARHGVRLKVGRGAGSPRQLRRPVDGARRSPPP